MPPRPRPAARCWPRAATRSKPWWRWRPRIAAVYPHMNHIGGDGFWLVREPNRPRARDHGGGAGRRAAQPRALSRARRDPDARAARGAHRAGRDRRLDAGAGGGAGRSAASCRSTCCLHAAIGQARDGYVVTPKPGAADGGKARRVEGRAGLRRRRSCPTASRRRPARRSSRARSPPRSIIWRMPGSTISIAATSGARSPPIWSGSAAR